MLINKENPEMLMIGFLRSGARWMRYASVPTILLLRTGFIMAAVGINATVSSPAPNPVQAGIQNTYYSSATLTGTTSQNETPVAKSWQWTVVSATYQPPSGSPVTIPATDEGGGLFAGGVQPESGYEPYYSFTVTVAPQSSQNPVLTGTFSSPGTWTLNLSVTATY